MQQHVKIVAILHIVLGAMGVCGALIAFAVLGGLGHFVALAESEDGLVAGGILGLIGMIVMIIVLVISLPGLIAGIGLLSYQPWARILTIIISAIQLPAFPFHTALGLYSLWVLLSDEGTALFKGYAAAVRT